MTLVEVMVAMGLFTIMSLATLTALVQTRKMSENNVAQATTAAIAQGIIEQAQLVDYTTLTTTASLPLNFTGPSSANFSSIQQRDIPWRTDGTFDDIGIRSDPADNTSPVLGIMTDLNYMSGLNIIRQAKYMKMKINLQRNIHTADDNVEIILTYSWQLPSGNGAASSPYLTREIRTVRSQASSY